MAQTPGGGPSPGWVTGAKTVTALTLALRGLVEEAFAAVQVTGEVSGDRPSAGHLYFTLKDEGAQVACVIWRSTLTRLRVLPRSGMKVALRGKIEVYPPHGKYQLIVSDVVDIGAGAIDAELRALAERLSTEGLFAPERKRPLPLLPRRVGVVTALTGAALQDVLRVIRDRFPADVLVAPARVQGEGAAATLVAALRAVESRVDVVLVTRGGGSSEDLSAFNDEALVRAVASCRVPVVSAIGHEIDVVLTDLAADLRMPTPSAAAARLVPDFDDLSAHVETLRGRLDDALARRLGESAQHLDRLLERLHPAFERRLTRARRRLDQLRHRLDASRPALRLAAQRARLARLLGALETASSRATAASRARLALATGRLEALSPLASLERGYAIVRGEGGAVIRDARDVPEGARVEVIVRAGRFHARREGDPEPEAR
jgi:exodeoxyribonuclease VII large subunit